MCLRPVNAVDGDVHSTSKPNSKEFSLLDQIHYSFSRNIFRHYKCPFKPPPQELKKIIEKLGNNIVA